MDSHVEDTSAHAVECVTPYLPETMKRLFALLLAAGTLLGSRAWAQEAMSIGIVPYLTPNVLMTLFKPLRTHLEQDIGRSFDLYTSPDVRTFVSRIRKPDFDLVVTSAHTSRLAQLEGGYQPLVRFNGPLRAAVVVARNASQINRLEDLRGKHIAITDRSILVNIAMLKTLSDIGLSEKDMQFVPVNSQNTGILAVARGDADAAIIAHFTLDQIPPEQRVGVRVIHTSADLPNVMILAKKGMKPELAERLRNSLLHLPDTSGGKEFLQNSRFIGIQAVDEAFMKTLDPLMPETRKQLNPG